VGRAGVVGNFYFWVVGQKGLRRIDQQGLGATCWALATFLSHSRMAAESFASDDFK